MRIRNADSSKKGGICGNLFIKFVFFFAGLRPANKPILSIIECKIISAPTQVYIKQSHFFCFCCFLFQLLAILSTPPENTNGTLWVLKRAIVSATNQPPYFGMGRKKEGAKKEGKRRTRKCFFIYKLLLYFVFMQAEHCLSASNLQCYFWK